MKIVIVDNYDSFTFNLSHLIAKVTGTSPVVVRNDAMSWPELHAMGFDAAVISPGPGRPQNPNDLGLTQDLILHFSGPILGVCLGHQALAYFSGARVELAAQPMHGRVDAVSHDGEDLFAGISSPFDAVRYHSLAVSELPSSVVPLAWAQDGTLMGLRHRDHPWWGVQFHPESICSDHGEMIIQNFVRLAKLPLPEPVAEQHLPDGQGRSSTGTLRARATRMEGWYDPESVFQDLYADVETCFWLDSSRSDTSGSRFSYMGDNSGPLAHVLNYDAGCRELTRHTVAGAEVLRETMLDHLAESIKQNSVSPCAGTPFDFHGGYVGYFGYELKSDLEGDASSQSPIPDAIWMFADRTIAFDHSQREIWLVEVFEEAEGPSSQWALAVGTALRTLRATPTFEQLRAHKPAADLHGFQWRHTRSSYRDMIERCQAAIREGETYEVCLTNELTAAGSIDAFAVYQMLRRKNPVPYGAYLRHGSLAVLSASPELFLTVSANGHVRSKPIKGTAPRGSTVEEDTAIASHLRSNIKDRAENLMIVDLLRNDIGRVCQVGSVTVPSLFAVESYATLHQLVSTIEGRLENGRTTLDCVRASFPGGSMTGAPKVRTMQIIDSLEGGPRGIYSGSIGYLSLSGGATLNIVIRTIVVTGEGISIGAGGAIVALSDPDEELDEVKLKAVSLINVLRDCGADVEGIRASVVVS